MNRTIVFALVGLVTLGGMDPSGSRSRAAAGWEERVAAPPGDARILKIIHPWPGTPEAQDQLIQHLKGQGFGGVVCNVSFDDYLRNETHWQSFVRAVHAARQAGFALWLYDERGYPSGNAGGRTLEGHPEWEARGLLAAETAVTGGAVAKLELPPGDPVLVRAYPEAAGRLDLGRDVDLISAVKDRRIEWVAPSGSWKVWAITESRLYEGTHADGNLHEKMPYPNLLLAEPTARFVDLTYGGYAKHLGENLGRFFEATFTDEPSLMSLFLKPMPYRPLPWAAVLPAEFRQRRGYDLERAHLVSLVADTGEGTTKFRYDFWLTIGELVSENYFGQIQERCRRHGVPSGGHLLAEEGLVGHVPLYGDFFRCIRRLDAPSMDCLTSVPSEVPWYVARLLASAAELEQRPQVMSETSDHSQVYRPAGDTRPRRVVTEAEIRGTAHRLAVAGVNVITSYYSFTELSDDALRRLNAWIGRACTALRGGHQVADVAVVYPAESLWTRFVPSRHWTREATAAARVENLYRTAADGLFASRRDFTFIDSKALVDARVESGALVHGPSRWRVVVLPGVDTLPLAAWEKLAALVRGGGVLIALGELPRHSEAEFPSARVQALAAELFGVADAGSAAPRSKTHGSLGVAIFLPAGGAGLLPRVIDGVLEPDVEVEGAKSPLRLTHRRIEGHDVYFVINDDSAPWTGEVRFSVVGEGERWDLASGRRAEAISDGKLRLNLGGYGAALFRFASARAPRRLPGSGSVLAGQRLSPMAAVAPTVIRGEFVRAELKADPERATTNQSAWRATATLTRGQVDTFQFAQFHFEPVQDWTGVDHLDLETWVPEGQGTPNQLLVILHEEGGGDFLLETGRSLAGPLYERLFLPLARFQLAGWSKDGDGHLDPRRIQDVRIGWGGYLGAEGEKVVFSVRLPQLGRSAGGP
ncbi:MAG: hypothetical protein JNK85_09420 [Verrucomicrobiales bacterium]|nr:hypothetical protein [Verrucomicrobiales bacterium]